MTTKGPILVTGFNGYLGQVVAKAVLEAGYPVRGTVRNTQAGQNVKNILLQQGYGEDLIELVHVADISAPGVFDKAVVGCTAIIHQASPTLDVMRLPPKEVSRIAVGATTSVVDSALAHAGPQLQSIVLMSSAGALWNYPFPTRVYTEQDWPHDMAHLVENDEKFNNIEPESYKMVASYSASKMSAERAFWEKRDALVNGKMSRVSFTAVLGTTFIGPAVVPWDTIESIPYSVKFHLAPLMGQDWIGLGGSPTGVDYPGTIDVRDVARVLLWSAVHADKASGQRIQLSGASGGIQAVVDLLDRWVKVTGERDEAGQNKLAIPAELEGLEVKHKGNPGKGYNKDYSWILDGSIREFDGRRAVELTGQDYIPFEQSILDTVVQALPAIHKAIKE